MARARQIRRPAPRAGQTGPRWMLFELSPTGSTFLEIDGERTLRSGASVRSNSGRLEFISDGPPALLNDVEFRGAALLRSGDVVKHADQVYLVLSQEAETGLRRGTVEHTTFMARTEGAIEQGEEFSLLLGRSTAFRSVALDDHLPREQECGASKPLAGMAARDLLEVLASKRALAQASDSSSRSAPQSARQGRRCSGARRAFHAMERLRRSSGRQPSTGCWVSIRLTAGRCRLLTRRWRLKPRERVAARQGALALVGEAGVGRETLARRIRATRLTHPSSSMRARDSIRGNGSSTSRAPPRRPARWPPGILPAQERAAFLAASRFVPRRLELTELRPLPSPIGSSFPTFETGLLMPSPSRPRPPHHRRSACSASDEPPSRGSQRSPADSNPENIRSLRNRVFRAALNLDGRRCELITSKSRRGHPFPGRPEGEPARYRTEDAGGSASATASNVSETAKVVRCHEERSSYRLQGLGIRGHRSRKVVELHPAGGVEPRQTLGLSAAKTVQDYHEDVISMVFLFKRSPASGQRLGHGRSRRRFRAEDISAGALNQRFASFSAVTWSP